MTKIEIKKRKSEEVVCWRVDAKGATPNTVIETDGNVTVLIRIDGVMRVQMGGTATIYSHFMPGKKNKLIGGKKPYEKIEIYAIDQTSEFLAEWGLAGDTALPCYDRALEVDCHAVAFGTYAYRVENFVNFISASSVSEREEITRDDLREMLRSEVAAVAKSCLTQKLAIGDIRACSMHLADFAEEIKEEINRHLDAKGLTVYNFTIEKLDYDAQHKQVKGVFTGAELDVKLGKIKNEGARDALGVESIATEIGNTRIRAIKGTDAIAASTDAAVLPVKECVQLPPAMRICPRCGEKNTDSNYCKKCGEKLA